MHSHTQTPPNMDTHAFTNSDTTHLNKYTQPSLCTYTPSYHHNIYVHIPSHHHTITSTTYTHNYFHHSATTTHMYTQTQPQLNSPAYISITYIFALIYSDTKLMNIYTQPPLHVYTHSVITTTHVCTHTQLPPSHTLSDHHTYMHKTLNHYCHIHI